MIFNFVIGLALSASLIAPHVAAECILTDKSILETTSVFFIELDNQYNLLLLDSVPANAKLHLVCADGTLDTFTCVDNAFDRTVTLQNCAIDKDLRSTVQVIDNDGNCPKPFIYYSVGYTFNGKHHEVYRSCFNPSTRSPAFSIHDKYHFSISSKGPNTGFGPAPVVTNIQANALKRDTSLAKLLDLLEKTHLKKDEQQKLNIDRGHLAPSVDFMFSKHKADTYRYVNIVPQFASNNQGNWNKMELFVVAQSNLKLSQRKKMQPRPRTAFRIITGGHGVLQLSHNKPESGKIPMYLLDTAQFPIPKWIYKVVSDDGHCTIYVTYNNVMDTPLPDAICRTVACPSKLKLEPGRAKGEIYCCDVGDFRDKNIVPNLEICENN